MDIGAEEIVVCVPRDENTQIVKAFGNYTVDLQAIGKWLQEHKVQTVAMESTGVYWIPLFEELERQGFECLLISSRSLGRVAGGRATSQMRSGSRPCTVMDCWKVHFDRRRTGGAANVVAPSRAITRSSLAAHPTHAEGVTANERAVIPGIERCDRGRPGSAIIRAIVAGDT